MPDNKNKDFLSLPKLNIPDQNISIGKNEGSIMIFDEFRKKYVVLTPEEWVRQNFLKYLVNNLDYPPSRLKLEASIKVGGKSKRCDAVFFDKSLNPEIVIEFKSVNIKLDQKVLDQIGTYNISLSAPFLIVSNGIYHYTYKIDHLNKKFEYLNEIPSYSQLKLI